MKLLILADDFTGALDTGVQLSLRNIPTCVVTSTQNTHNYYSENCEVLAFNMETRHLPEKSAYNSMKSVLEKYATPGHFVYIKTDSALRGNISAAIQAALDTIGGPLAFVPALPALGRTTKNATCYVNGELLENSVFRKDPRTPTLKSYIPDILKTPCASFTTTLVPFDRLEKFQQIMKDSPADVYLFDCETNEQLNAIGQMLASHHMYGLTAGCAGFASTFEAHIPFRKETFGTPKDDGPILFVSGSANAVTLAQLQFAKEQGYPVFSLADQIYNCYRNNTDLDVSKWQIYKKALSYLSTGHSVIIASAASKEELREINDPRFHETVAMLTSSLVQLLTDASNAKTLCVFGGDMVASILKQLGCDKVSARGEIRPGVPLCTFFHQGKIRCLVTKSGGFGDEDMIPAIEHYFHT